MAALILESEGCLPSRLLPPSSNILTIVHPSFHRRYPTTALAIDQPLGLHHLQAHRSDKLLPLQFLQHYNLITHSYLSPDVRFPRKMNALYVGKNSHPKDLMAMTQTALSILRIVLHCIPLRLAQDLHLHHRRQQAFPLSALVV
jgi:hypothetical protein